PPGFDRGHRDGGRGPRQAVVDRDEGRGRRPVHGEELLAGQLLASPGPEIAIQLAHARSSNTSASAFSARHCFALTAPGVVPMAAATSSLVMPTRYFSSMTWRCSVGRCSIAPRKVKISAVIGSTPCSGSSSRGSYRPRLRSTSIAKYLA